jgi:ATP-dependent RNA helicase RhlE
MGPQISGFKADTDILVATPGRLADHIRRRNVRLDKIEHLVLDEADHMLDLGFLPQIKEILEELPEKRQTMMFSATMPPPIESLSRLFMKDPVRVDLRPKGHTAEGIEHRLYLVKDEDDRKHCLFQLLREEAGTTLVFARRKIHTEWLARQLELGGFEVERIHSDRSQGQRVSALKGFREGDHRILVATDVAARGIDVPSIEHVINYGFPDTVEDYIHRSGRTARGAALGIVSSIATWQEKEAVRDIEVAIGQDLPRCRVEGVEPYVEMKPRKQVRRRRLL